jgi:hypothetical protein
MCFCTQLQTQAMSYAASNAAVLAVTAIFCLQWNRFHKLEVADYHTPVTWQQLQREDEQGIA